jgi:iron transport multicopper oxidase
MNSEVYGVNSNPIVVNYGDIVEVIINNFSPGGHPWHLHGHKFQAVARSNGNVLNSGIRYDGTNLPKTPMRRDTVGVRGGGYVVLRFKGDNPGVQLIHCHIEWHVSAGLTASIIEATDQINFKIPNDHQIACNVQNIPTQGNAAGNTRNPLDLAGAITEVPQSDSGAIFSLPKRKGN